VEGDSLSAECCCVLHVMIRLGCRVLAFMPKRNE
jgi:hypothetical protein